MGLGYNNLYLIDRERNKMIHFEEGSNDFYVTKVQGEIFIQANKDGHPMRLDFWVPAIQEEALKALAFKSWKLGVEND